MNQRFHCQSHHERYDQDALVRGERFLQLTERVVNSGRVHRMTRATQFFGDDVGVKDVRSLTTHAATWTSARPGERRIESKPECCIFGRSVTRSPVIVGQ